MVYRGAVAKQRSTDEWTRLVTQWEASGQSGSEFARVHGVGASSLYWWGRRLRAAPDIDEPGPAFTEVRVVERKETDDVGVIEIDAQGGRTIRVVGEVDPDQLRAVLKVIETC